MTLTPIPYSFIQRHAALSWRDVLWGYDRQFIGWPDVVYIADERLLQGSDNPNEIELSCLRSAETQKVRGFLRVLADQEPINGEGDSERKWLFLLLARLFEMRADITDPLREVERIYADFDYPSEIESFVRYMPVTEEYDPSQHTTEENNVRLFEKWEQYLLMARRELGATDSAI